MLSVYRTATETPNLGGSPQVSWGSIARNLTPVDGGIKRLALRDFVQWSTGVTDAIGIRPSNLTISRAFGFSDALRKALEENETRYANYVHARDFAEYWESGADLSRGFDGRTFAILALENYLGAGRDGFTVSLPDESSEAAGLYAYDRLAAILGTQPILAASEKILSGKKESYPDPGGALVSMLADQPKALPLHVLRPPVERPFRRSNFDAYDRAIAQYGEARVNKVTEMLWKGRNAGGGYGASKEPLASFFEKLAKDPDTPLPPPIPHFSASDVEGIRTAIREAKLKLDDLIIVEGTLQSFLEKHRPGPRSDQVDIGFKESAEIFLVLKNLSPGEIKSSDVVGRRKAVEGMIRGGGGPKWNPDARRWEIGAEGTIVVSLTNDQIRALLAR
jgi:hypothetical protein